MVQKLTLCPHPKLLHKVLKEVLVILLGFQILCYWHMCSCHLLSLVSLLIIHHSLMVSLLFHHWCHCYYHIIVSLLIISVIAQSHIHYPISLIPFCFHVLSSQTLVLIPTSLPWQNLIVRHCKDYFFVLDFIFLIYMFPFHLHFCS